MTRYGFTSAVVLVVALFWIKQGDASATLATLFDQLCALYDAVLGTIFYFTSRDSRKEAGNFVYGGLRKNHNEIRLIKVIKTWPFSKPVYSLITSSLDSEELPSYDAMSYTWDGQERVLSVGFSGGNLLTTPNVRRMLQQRASSLRTVYLWVDAICINQDDNEEKETQLPLMAKIYQKSRRTLTWLDSDTVKPSDALRLELLFFLIENVVRYFRGDELVLNYMTLFVLAPASSRSLKRFLEHSYWSRMWIIQEIARGPKVHMLYGRHMLDWDRVHRALWLRTQPPLDKYLIKNTIVGNVLQASSARARNANAGIDRNAILFLNGIRRAVSLQPLSLPYALEMSSQATAGREEDKVFALYGLIVHDTNVDTPVAKALRVDYKAGADVIFTRLSEHLASEEGDPEYLFSKAGVGRPRQKQSLPSWVLDCTYKPHTIEANDPLYRAGGDPVAVTLSIDVLGNRRLRLRLIEVARLSKLTEIYPSKTQKDKGPITTFYESAQDLIKDAPDICGWCPQQSKRERFWRTIIGDMDRTPIESGNKPVYPVPADWADKFEDWIRSPLGPDGDYRQLVKTSDIGSEFDFNFNITCHRNRFAVTDKGEFALVPEKAERDDIVCICPGLSQTLLMRQTKESLLTMELVGSCYTHGLMNGEGLKDGARGTDYIIV